MSQEDRLKALATRIAQELKILRGSIPATPTWSELAGKPAVIGAGATQADARTAIGAGTSSLAIGTTATTAAAGNRAATETAIGMVERATDAEATAGTDTTRYITPKHLANAVGSINAALQAIVNGA